MTDDALNGVRLLTVLVLLVLCGLGVRRFKTLVNPVVVACLPWALILALQQVFAPVFPFSERTSLVILGFLIVFTAATLVGSLCGRAAAPLGALAIAEVEPLGRRWRVTRWIIVGILFANVAILLYFAFVLGIGPRPDGSFDQYTLFKVVETSPLGWPQRIGTTFIYVGAALFAFELAFLGRPSLAFVVFGGTVLALAVLIGLRSTAYLVVTIVVLGYLAIRARQYAGLSLKHVGIVAVFVVFVAAFSWVTIDRRYGFGNTQRSALYSGTLVSLLGAPSGLSLYLDRSDDWIAGTQSGISISGPLAILGLGERPNGIYSEDQLLTPDATESEQTNQYTGLRPLLDDAGVLGGGIVAGILGWWCGRLCMAVSWKPSLGRYAVLANLYLLLAWLPITWQSIYVYWTAQFVVVTLLARFCFQLRKEPRRDTTAALA